MVGSNIKKLRKRRRYTQKALADILGVSRQAICMWEANRREPDVDTLNKMAKFFGVMLDEIIRPQGIIFDEGEVRGMVAVRSKTSVSKAAVRNKEDRMAKKSISKRIDFKLVAPQANRVVLTGDFNSWDESGISMKKSKAGLWKTVLDLVPGRYEYKFIVDGQWWLDPDNNSISTNPFGSKNSVKDISF